MTLEEALKKLRQLNDRSAQVLAVVPNNAVLCVSGERKWHECWDVVVLSGELYCGEGDEAAWLYGRAATIQEAVEQAEAKLEAMR